MAPEALRAAIDKFSLSLIETGLAIDRNWSRCLGQADRKVLITWASSGIAAPFTKHDFATLPEYVAFVKNRQFSALLFDGSLLQMSYTVKGNDEIVDHRLCWYPCPAVFQPADLELAPLDEFVQSTPSVMLLCRGPLRFDYSPDQADIDHSATHFHAFQEDCRIPVKGPLDIATFADFIFGQFYRKRWDSMGGRVAKTRWEGRCTLDLAEYDRPHVFWRTVA